MIGGMPVQDALDRIERGEADTLVVLENDLARRASPAQLQSVFSKVKNVIALDCIETDVTRSAQVIMPVTAYVESDGTFVNNEGRAQRFFQAFIPPGEPRHSWSVLGEMAGRKEIGVGELRGCAS